VGLFDAEVRRWHDTYSDPVQHRQFAAFRQAVLDRPGAVVIELGGGVPGLSTAMFLSATDEVQVGAYWADGEVWSVDLQPAQVPAGWHGLPYWHFLQGDDLHPAVQAWLPQQCDVLFIDSAHTYGHTLAELRAYVPRIRGGGAALLHDTQWDHGNVELAGPTGPVARALDDFCAGAGLSWENLPGSFGLGTILF
jgi:cephalosporin hydroxylase